MAARDPSLRPYLKWAGGKRQLLPEIKKYLPKDLEKGRYYEPFVGGGAVLFEEQPKRAVINDSNTDLMLTYRAIRDHIGELIEALNVHKNTNSREYFFEVRGWDRDAEKFKKLPEVERAARLIFLNKTCYNGLYRVNARGLFNVPYGCYPKPAICDEPALRAVHTYLRNNEVEILNEDFADAVRTADERSFVYFDPPYHSSDRVNFTAYQAEKFDEKEQRRLRDAFAALTERGVRCLLSNSDTAFIRQLYDDARYDIVPVVVKYAINPNVARHSGMGELLIRNWK